MIRNCCSHLLALLACVATATACGQERVSLYTFLAPPYQELNGIIGGVQIISGLTVDTVTCATEKAGWEPYISLVPQSRAIYALRNNATDGYFAGHSTPELNRTLTHSNPVALEKWYFYSLKPDINPSRARIGVVNGSNEHLWLEDNGYDAFLTVSSAPQLLALLSRQRIDTALMDSRVMQSLLARSNELNKEQIYRRFLRYTPLYLYVSPDFNRRHPDFLDGFNTYLADCLSGQFALDNEERATLVALANELRDILVAETDLLNAILSGPRMESLAEILKADSLWQALATEEETELARQITQLPASDQLTRFVSRYQGLITEIMLTNDMGTVVAMSQLTSDYWQGDEPKFREMLNKEAGQPWISSIRYDRSTSQFQVIASYPVSYRNQPEAAGVLMIGLDIGKALEQQPGH
ncbi:MAG: transporter substrate-binding domain-containing protein [Pseudomonadota bacterium]|nr:transporter substrate-binding domain-containing protein [Pseudomonadota bacterium]